MKVQKHTWIDSNDFGFEYLIFTYERTSYLIYFSDDQANITEEYDYIYNPKDEYEPTDKEKHMAIKRLFTRKWWIR